MCRILSKAISPIRAVPGHYMSIIVTLRMREHRSRTVDSSIQRNHRCRNDTVQIHTDSMLHLSKSTLTGTSCPMFHTLRRDSAGSCGILHEGSYRHSLPAGHIRAAKRRR